MLTSETTIETDRPYRYLVQLCRHAAAMGRTSGGHRSHVGGGALARGELRVSAEHTDTRGLITIHPWGRCVIEAADRSLTLRVEAADQDALRQIQTVVTRDLERFGRRDALALTWPPARTTSADVQTGEVPATSKARPRRRSVILLAVLVAVAVAIHLGIGGAILARAPWAGLSIDVIVVIVAAKILLAVFGGRTLRRRLHTWTSHQHGSSASGHTDTDQHN